MRWKSKQNGKKTGLELRGKIWNAIKPTYSDLFCDLGPYFGQQLLDARVHAQVGVHHTT